MIESPLFFFLFLSQLSPFFFSLSHSLCSRYFILTPFIFYDFFLLLCFVFFYPRRKSTIVELITGAPSNHHTWQLTKKTLFFFFFFFFFFFSLKCEVVNIPSPHALPPHSRVCPPAFLKSHNCPAIIIIFFFCPGIPMLAHTNYETHTKTTWVK